MRGLVVKIFGCSVLVQIITHLLWLSMAVFFAADVPSPARLLQHTLPMFAALAHTTLERDGPDALAAMLAQAERDGDVRLQVKQNLARCAADWSMGPGAQAARDGTFCLFASSNRPAGPHLWPDGIVVAQLMVCFVFSYGIARYLLQPVHKLSLAAEALGRGDLTARAGPRLGRRRDEVGALVRQFDRMADRIAALIQSQQRFIGDVSHEIKSPLARLTMAIGLARREADGRAAARFDRMEVEIDTISALIRELLTLSSLQASDVADQSRLVDLQDLVRSVVDDAGFEWRERLTDIRLTLPDERIRLRGDPTLLRRAFENVLRNAMFYTPAGTVVNVVIRQAGTQVTLLVQDQGPGVPPDALEHLFDPFYRVDNARARNTGGVGVGLAICERAVRLHGGAVRACNVSPSGLAVSLDLPCAEPHPIAIA